MYVVCCINFFLRLMNISLIFKDNDNHIQITFKRLLMSFSSILSFYLVIMRNYGRNLFADKFYSIFGQIVRRPRLWIQSSIFAIFSIQIPFPRSRSTLRFSAKKQVHYCIINKHKTEQTSPTSHKIK